MTNKQKALIKYCKENDCNIDNYLIYTDSEADEACKEYIKESLWAFRASFLNQHIKLSGRNQDIIESIEAMQIKMSENCNDIIYKLIDDFDALVEDAIRWDGRGHFLSSYDGEEIEYKYGKNYYYIYRIN